MLAITLASAFLTACARHSAADPFLNPCVIEGPHQTVNAVIDDPSSTTRSLVDFAGQAEDAVARCNDDKKSIRKVLGEKP